MNSGVFGAHQKQTGNSSLTDSSIATDSTVSSKNYNNKKIAASYIGRFAPSPTGPLHFGSLIAAIASFLCARHQPDGRWLLRMEDLDTVRCRQDYADSILTTLEKYGFSWDSEVVYQSKRSQAYQAALDSISEHIYHCSCTRKQLLAQVGENKRYAYLYPGNCRKSLQNPEASRFAIRLKTYPETICFNDRIQGEFCQNLFNDVGDFILKRSDGLFAYQLAVVVDDAWQGVTEVVRGADLFDNTPRQIYLQGLLGYPTPDYLHFPVATTQDGKKLSKQNLAPEINSNNPHTIISQLLEALVFLGQNPPKRSDFGNLDDVWRWAIQNWNINNIPKKMKILHEQSTDKRK